MTSESLLSDITILPISPMPDINLDQESTVSLNVDASETSKIDFNTITKNRPLTLPNEYIYENCIILEDLNQNDQQEFNQPQSLETLV